MLSRRLSVCVEFHGGHDGRSAKAERLSAASPNFSQLSARGCTAVGSSTLKKIVLAEVQEHGVRGSAQPFADRRRAARLPAAAPTAAAPTAAAPTAAAPTAAAPTAATPTAAAPTAAAVTWRLRGVGCHRISFGHQHFQHRPADTVLGEGREELGVDAFSAARRHVGRRP
eukprot:scaffold46010_cov60-Phaeocystis_antarctica.AAC.3